MKIRVMFLGPARDWAGVESAAMDWTNVLPVSTLRQELVRQFPQLAPALPAMRVAVNQLYAGDQQSIRPGDEVALIPPVSGG